MKPSRTWNGILGRERAYRDEPSRGLTKLGFRGCLAYLHDRKRNLQKQVTLTEDGKQAKLPSHITYSTFDERETYSKAGTYTECIGTVPTYGVRRDRIMGQFTRKFFRSSGNRFFSRVKDSRVKTDKSRDPVLHTFNHCLARKLKLRMYILRTYVWTPAPAVVYYLKQTAMQCIAAV